MQQNNYDLKKIHRRRDPRDGSWSEAATILLPWSCAIIVFLISSIVVSSYRNSYVKIYTQFTTGKELLKDHQSTIETLKNAVGISKSKDSYDEELNGSEYERNRKDEVRNMKIAQLQKHVRKESHREIVDRFGDGIHQVQVEVIFPFLENGVAGDESNEAERTKSFILEMAPLGMMPHSVHIFLEQVHHNLWDGCVFSFHDGGKLSVSTSSVEKVNEFLPRFQDAELDTVSFQEYNENYEHEKYTIGFSGRPGGPNWYINTRDNVEANGPGGKSTIYDLKHEADPCFGRVVDGIEVIEELISLPTARSGFFDHFPVIKSTMRLPSPRVF